MWEWMGCDQYFPWQPFVVLTVDQFVRRSGGLFEWQKQNNHVYRSKIGTLPLIIRRNQSRHYINDKVWELWRRCGSLRPFPNYRQFNKPQNSRIKIIFQIGTLNPTVSTSAFHSTQSFLFSLHHIPTNSLAPFPACKPTHSSQFLQSLFLQCFDKK